MASVMLSMYSVLPLTTPDADMGPVVRPQPWKHSPLALHDDEPDIATPSDVSSVSTMGLRSDASSSRVDSRHSSLYSEAPATISAPSSPEGWRSSTGEGRLESCLERDTTRALTTPSCSGATTEDSKGPAVVTWTLVYTSLEGKTLFRYSTWMGLTQLCDRHFVLEMTPGITGVDIMDDKSAERLTWCFVEPEISSSPKQLAKLIESLLIDNNPHVIPRTMTRKAARWGTVTDIRIRGPTGRKGTFKIDEPDKWARLDFDREKLRPIVHNTKELQAILQEFTLLRLKIS